MKFDIEKPEKFKKYKKVDDLLRVITEGLPVDGGLSVGYSDGEVTLKEFKRNLDRQGIWGFVDEKGIVHYWMKEGVAFDTVLAFIAHETGHLNGKKYKYNEKEENKATTFDGVAVYAYRMANKLLKRK